MKVRINSEINYRELIVEDIGEYKEDYQIPMIRENPIKGLLKVAGRGIDDRSQYLYDITGYESMEQRFEKMCMDREILEAFLKQFLHLVVELKRHMLDINKLLLEPAYIFYKEEQYYFCYYPANQKQVTETFHELTEYFVKTIDYGNIESVILACGLHKETMGEAYHIETLLEKKVEPSWECLEESYGDIEEDHKEIEETQEMRETPLKRFWSNKKRETKEKWGAWENLLRNEESSIMKNK